MILLPGRKPRGHAWRRSRVIAAAVHCRSDCTDGRVINREPICSSWTRATKIRTATTIGLRVVRSRRRDANVAKVWIDPVRIADRGGFRASELRDIERLASENGVSLLEV